MSTMTIKEFNLSSEELLTNHHNWFSLDVQTQNRKFPKRHPLRLYQNGELLSQ
jgi:hypothetical protein